MEKTEELDKDNEKLRKWVQGEEKRYFVTIVENRRELVLGVKSTGTTKLKKIKTESVKLVE